MKDTPSERYTYCMMEFSLNKHWVEYYIGVSFIKADRRIESMYDLISISSDHKFQFPSPRLTGQSNVNWVRDFFLNCLSTHCMLCKSNKLYLDCNNILLIILLLMIRVFLINPSLEGKVMNLYLFPWVFARKSI